MPSACAPWSGRCHSSTPADASSAFRHRGSTGPAAGRRETAAASVAMFSYCSDIARKRPIPLHQPAGGRRYPASPRQRCAVKNATAHVPRLLYAKGLGVNRDFITAYAWFTVAFEGYQEMRDSRMEFKKYSNDADVSRNYILTQLSEKEKLMAIGKVQSIKLGIDINFPSTTITSTPENSNLYSGNTAIGTSANGTKFRVYFREDGAVFYNDKKGVSQKGRWVLKNNGLMCYDWQAWKDQCYLHERDGDIYQSYREGIDKGSKFRIIIGDAPLN